MGETEKLTREEIIASCEHAAAHIAKYGVGTAYVSETEKARLHREEIIRKGAGLLGVVRLG
jgi:nicotinic acid phosphoribosyltransferase